MKNRYFITLIFTVGVLCSNLIASAQQINPTTITVSKVQVVNFKALSDSLLKHPVQRELRYIEQGEDKEHGVTFIPHKGQANSPIYTPPNISARSTTVSPSPRISFAGVISNESDFPPDINGAVGNQYILETTNQEYDILNKNGTINSIVDIPTFFASQNGTYFYDPHVEYDVAHQRYILISDGFYVDNDATYPNPSAIFVGVSETNDPTGNWYTYSFNGFSVDSADFLDYPLLGYNKNWVVVTGNDYTGTGGVQVNVWVLNRANLYNGTLGNVKEFSIPNYTSITPTQTYDTTITEDYLVQDDNGDQGGVGYDQIGQVAGTLNNPTVSVGSTIGVSDPWNDNTTGMGATQLGTTTSIESGLTTEIENSVYRNGYLWFTQTVYLPASSPTHSAIDWWQVDPGTLTIVQFGRIEDPAGVIDYYYPSISVDANSDVLVGYTTSSPNIYAGSMYSFRAATDPLNTMQGGYLYQSGQATYTLIGDNRNRWGDFSFTTVDPTDNSFWTFQEFSASPSSTWGTVIANVGGTACSNKPSAGTIVTGVDTLCSGDGTILNLVGNTSNVNGIHLQWQQSANGTNGWQTSSGGIGDTTDSYSTAPLTATAYFRCIATCLNSGLSDTTSIIKISLPGVYSITNDTVCLAGNYNLTASGIGTTFSWYHSSSGGSSFYTGKTLNATISKDTTLYVNTTLVKYYSAGIPDDNADEGSYFSANFSDGLLFNAISNFTLDSLFVYPSSTGTVVVNLTNASNNSIVSTVTATISGADLNQKTVIRTKFNCIAGTSYNITASNSSVSQLFRTSAYANYPYVVPGILSITAPNNSATGHYYFFYDWRISTTCSSPVIPINVLFGALAVKATATPDSLCTGSKTDSILLKVRGGNTYLWNNSSIDSSFYVKPTATTVYTVTGSNSSGCKGTSDVSVFVGNCTEGVNAIASNTPDIEVYPNPTTRQFDLVMNQLPNQAYTISLYNIIGQKVMEKQIQVNSSQFTLPLDVSNLPAEMYFIRIANNNLEWTKRITKL